MKLVPPTFSLGQTLYLRVNAGLVGMVTGILYRPGGGIMYLVTWSEDADEKQHWACELSADKEWVTGEDQT